jgi:hypothetical protein
MKIILKELRETRISLIIIKMVPLSNDLKEVENAMVECNELISIFRKSCITAEKNLETKRSGR